MNDPYARLRRQAQERAHAAGEGTWFRKADHAEVHVDVSFYPRIQRWVTEGGERRRISEAELAADYDRLAL